MLVFAHPGSEVDAERKKTSTLGESHVQPMSGQIKMRPRRGPPP